MRFIHVDPSNPKKPQDLHEALPVAIKEYAKKNKNSKDNLLPGMKEMIEKLDYETVLSNSIKSLYLTAVSKGENQDINFRLQIAGLSLKYLLNSAGFQGQPF